MFGKVFFVSSLLLSLASAGVVASRNTTACNNSPDLCERSYSSITHLGAHDSAFVRDSSTDFSTSGNQYYNATVALSAGVRMLTAQVHNNNGELHLCHTSCDLLDAGKLSDWLSDIKSWMDSNPNDVVTLLLVNSDDASAQDLDTQFKSSGITKYSYTPTSTSAVPSSWPTLQELISQNTRVLTFIASLDPSSNTLAPYLMDEFTFIWENPFDNSNPSNFSCLPDRPSSVKGSISSAVSSGRMSLMNHFLYNTQVFGIEEPDINNINTTNAPSGGTGNLGTTAASCKTAIGQAPTFILVDFFDQGPALATVDKLNGITAVGRTAVPNTNSEATNGNTQTSGAGRSRNNLFKGLADLTATVATGATPSLGNWIWAGANWGAMGGVSI